MIKPLFIPLKREFFEAFRDGTKTWEYRPAGRRWNHHTCWIGRPVVLSLGYGKAHRLRGTVTCFTVSMEPTTTEAWKACYGDKHPGAWAACIGITLEAQP